MKKISMLMTAAFAGLALAGAGISANQEKAKEGECHGINGCKGTGDCGGKTHDCAGKNACKGKGWKKMTEAQCKAKKGKFQALTMGM